nr:MAG TPA: hypothetical protein [Caudoviricetes sp.]
MADFAEEIKKMITEYDEQITVSDLVINLAIEAFKELRNYPGAWDEDKILTDLEKNKAKIAMAAIEIDSKNGAENQLSHSENGTSRTYSEYLMAYKGVVGFANCV